MFFFYEVKTCFYVGHRSKRNALSLCAINVRNGFFVSLAEDIFFEFNYSLIGDY